MANKLRLENGDCLPVPSACGGSGDISFVPSITVSDIYNYLLNFAQYDHTTLRNYYKMEGYTMFQDGFVLDVWTAAQLYPSQTFHQVALRLRKRVKLYPFHLCFVLLPIVAGTAAPSTVFRRHLLHTFTLRFHVVYIMLYPHVTFDCSATWRIHIPD